MKLVVHNHFTSVSPKAVASAAARVLRTQDYLRVGRASFGRTTHDRAPDHDEAKDGPCGCGYYKTVDSKVDEYMARVDAWLAGLPDVAAKRKFLQKQRVDFERRYTDYRRRAGSGGKMGPNESAQAYVETLTGLTTRLNRLGA